MSWELILGIFIGFAVVGAVSGWFRPGDRRVKTAIVWVSAALGLSFIGMLIVGSSFSDAVILVTTNGIAAVIAIAVDGLVHQLKNKPRSTL